MVESFRKKTRCFPINLYTNGVFSISMDLFFRNDRQTQWVRKPMMPEHMFAAAPSFGNNTLSKHILWAHSTHQQSTKNLFTFSRGPLMNLHYPIHCLHGTLEAQSMNFFCWNSILPTRSQQVMSKCVDIWSRW